MKVKWKCVNSSLIKNELARTKSIRAERRAGEMLREMELAPGRPPENTNSNIVLPFNPQPKLEELGISKIQSHRWRREKQGALV